MVNCLIIGDMGKGTEDQHSVARSMKKLRNKYKTKFVLGLGDNIYLMDVLVLMMSYSELILKDLIQSYQMIDGICV